MSSGTITVLEPPWVILREVSHCPLCAAYTEGYTRAPAGGFCKNCGTHYSLLKRKRRPKTVASAWPSTGGDDE
jgi:hypothetical protein